MSTPITPVATVPPATYPIPAPGEGVTSANTAQYVQPLTNSIAWVQSKVPGLNPSTALLDIVYPSIAAFIPAGATDWGGNFSAAAYGIQFQNTIAAPTSVIVLALDSLLVQGMVIRAFSVDWCGANGHGALPATKPLVSLYRAVRGIGNAYLTFAGSNAATLIDSQGDIAASVAAYEVGHAIGKTLAAPETVDLATNTYTLRVKGEYGANALANSVWTQARISVSY